MIMSKINKKFPDLPLLAILLTGKFLLAGKAGLIIIDSVSAILPLVIYVVSLAILGTGLAFIIGEINSKYDEVGIILISAIIFDPFYIYYLYSSLSAAAAAIAVTAAVILIKTDFKNSFAVLCITAVTCSAVSPISAFGAVPLLLLFYCIVSGKTDIKSKNGLMIICVLAVAVLSAVISTEMTANGPQIFKDDALSITYVLSSKDTLIYIPGILLSRLYLYIIDCVLFIACLLVFLKSAPKSYTGYSEKKRKKIGFKYIAANEAARSQFVISCILLSVILLGRILFDTRFSLTLPIFAAMFFMFDHYRETQEIRKRFCCLKGGKLAIALIFAAAIAAIVLLAMSNEALIKSASARF